MNVKAEIRRPPHGPGNRLPLVYALVILSTVATAAIGHAAIGRSVDRATASTAHLDATHAELGTANQILGYAVGFRQSDAGGASTQVMMGMRDALKQLQALHASTGSDGVAVPPDLAAQLPDRTAQAESSYSNLLDASNALLSLSQPGTSTSQGEIDAAIDRVASTQATFSDALGNVQAIYEQSTAEATGALRSEEFALVVSIVLLLLAQIVFLIAPAHRNATQSLERSIRSQEQNARIGSEVARHVAVRDRKEAETQFQTLFRNATVGVALTNDQGRILDTNPALQRMLGYTAGELAGSRFGEWAKPDARIGMVQDERRDAASSSTLDCERVYVCKDGREIWVEERVSKASAPGGDGLICLGMAQDITARKEAERRLRHDATHDALTGLSNRKVFQRAIERAYRNASTRDAAPFAVLMIDLDRFKFVNDSRGHRFGDAVLAEVGRRLRTWAGPDDVVARFGGDEFTAMMTQLRDQGDAQSRSDQLHDALSQPIVLGDLTIRTTASIGICLWSPAVQSAEEMLQAADAAAYRAKANGRACSVVYDVDMAARDRVRTRIGTELRSAIERNQLRVVYQPLFELSRRSCTGFEALLRWTHPELGVVSPSIFIPVAEESGLIAPIGNFVLREASRQLAQWRGIYPRHDFKMNVNVSTQQFVDPKFFSELESTLRETGLPGEALGLEITETTMLDGERLAGDLLEAIRRTGARLVLDDFGTGYSSFGYLQRLPISSLKIDQRFVGGRDGALAAPPIVRALLALSSSMKIDVIAEGVETEQQARELLALGCRYVQGYHFAMPLEVDDVAGLARALAMGTRESRIS